MQHLALAVVSINHSFFLMAAESWALGHIAQYLRVTDSLQLSPSPLHQNSWITVPFGAFSSARL
jgi:hypothetical protein